MYIKEIYENWDLHANDTELEIKFNLFKKLIKILNTKSLRSTDNQKIIDSNIIRNWQNLNIQKLLEQYNLISNNNFFNVPHHNNDNQIIKSLFILLNILFDLKVLN
ncbi:MAG: hypothetical protein ACRC4L_03145, partial [Mycoplasma sp.]